ncbi:MAG: ABC transporter substrate-binding protein [Chloroflexi bacterium]|nr:ABC transporter substrate-binding protein [Chloroflexota bacterium]
MLFIGLDDTDNAESRGTGRLARMIAEDLARNFHLHGVIRHQLAKDAAIPMTKKNSSASIMLGTPAGFTANGLVDRIKTLMLADFMPGSDPGLCVATAVSPDVIAFGQRAKQQIMTQEDARHLAERSGLTLLGLGGTEDGVIGALASVGLAASGDDGRYIIVGRSREISGELPVAEVLAAGIDVVQTPGGEMVSEGLIAIDKLRPARRGGQAVAYVEWDQGVWRHIRYE